MRWTDEGTLIVAGQTVAPQEVFYCEAERRSCPMGVVARIDREAFLARPILRGEEHTYAITGFGGATGAIKIGKTILVGSCTGCQAAHFNTSALRGEDR